jgi:hypothetical protein
MSSWAVLLSSTGFKVDAPSGTVTFAPAVKGDAFRAPWVSSGAWGSFSIERGRCDIACTEGDMLLKAVRLAIPPGKHSAKLNGRDLPLGVSGEEGLLTLRFSEEQTLRAGDRLIVE